MPTSSIQTLDTRRLRAVAILRYGSVDALQKRLPLCPRAIANQIRRGALSDPVRQAFIAQLGADAWRFVIGESNVLIIAGSPDAAA